LTRRQAIAFVHKHGIVLESASGAAPSLAEKIAGAPIRGSWWAHPRSHNIFRITRAVRDVPDILVCRLVDGKITFVHRRPWPSLVRLADRFPLDRLAQLHEIHTDSGRHVVANVAFPAWVPKDIAAEAAELSDEQAASNLGSLTPRARERPS
jgi:hypothetical protein